MRVIAVMRAIFTIVGTLLLAIALYLHIDARTFIAKATTTQGTVIELIGSNTGSSRIRKPMVEFVSNNGERVEFISSVGSNPPRHAKGDTVEVFYLASDPKQARINNYMDLWFAQILLFIMGTAFFLFGAGLFLYAFLNKRKIAYLKSKGVPIRAEFEGVHLNTAYRSNGRSPYRVHAQWLNPKTSKLHLFKSENIWFNPSDYIKEDQLTVLIDERNPKKHYIDLSFLPELAD